MRIFRFLRVQFLFLISLILFISTENYAQTAKWTVMVYLDADNDLENAAIADLNEMEAIGSDENLNIIVQCDRIDGYNASNGNWVDTRRFRITKDENLSIFSTPPLQILGELNMGDEATLYDFISWSVSNYPADRYAIIIWNHGGGMWKEIRTTLNDKNICYDDTDNDFLSNAEVGSAIKNSGLYFDIVAYDACLMAMAEVGYQIRDNANIMIASEENIPWDGFDYTASLKKLSQLPEMNAKSLAEILINSYSLYYSSERVTLSAVKVANLTMLGEKLDTLIKRIIQQGNSWKEVGIARSNTQEFSIRNYCDLWSFTMHFRDLVEDTLLRRAATELMKAIDTSVIFNYACSEFQYAKGLSIYFPENIQYYDDEYANPTAGRDFANKTGWPYFLTIFYSKYFQDLSEPNNQFANASIENSKIIYGKLNDNDLDFYRFFYNGSNSNAEIILDTDSDINMYLYSITDTIITKLDSACKVGLRIKKLNLDGRNPDYYYILLKQDRTDESIYKLELGNAFESYDYVNESLVTYAYENGEKQKLLHAVKQSNGAGMKFKANGTLYGIWYYIDSIADQITEDLSLNIYAYYSENSYQEMLKERISYEKIQIGWNYLNLLPYHLTFNNTDIMIGFTDSTRSYFLQTYTMNTSGNSFTYNGDRWLTIDSMASVIRPVFFQKNLSQNDFCLCESLIILNEYTDTISDGSGESFYGNNCDCSWLIKPPNARSISLNFKNVKTENDYDMLQVFAGDSKNSVLLASLSGSIYDSTITCNSGEIFIRFSSDGSVGESGFSINYISKSDETLLRSKMEQEINVYPNPGDGILTIESSEDVAISEVKIFNTLGELVYTESYVSNSQKIDISNQVTGIYIINLKTSKDLKTVKYLKK